MLQGRSCPRLLSPKPMGDWLRKFGSTGNSVFWQWSTTSLTILIKRECQRRLMMIMPTRHENNNVVDSWYSMTLTFITACPMAATFCFVKETQDGRYENNDFECFKMRWSLIPLSGLVGLALSKDIPNRCARYTGLCMVSIWFRWAVLGFPQTCIRTSMPFLFDRLSVLQNIFQIVVFFRQFHMFSRSVLQVVVLFALLYVRSQKYSEP